MNSSTSRYARALADVAVSHKADGAAVVRELESMAEMLKSSPDLRTVWETPSVAAPQCRNWRCSTSLCKAGRHFTGSARNFVCRCLIDHRLATPASHCHLAA